MQKKQFTLTFLFYPDDDGSGKLVGHCLEMDIVALGKKLTDCSKLLRELVHMQFKYAIKNNTLDTLFRPAPQKYWSMLSRSRIVHPKELESVIKKKRVLEVVDIIKYNTLIPA